MKFFSFSLVVIAIFCSGLAAQESEPIMKGSGAYSMPQSAIDAELGGTVLVAVRIDSTGRVADAKIAAGPMWPCGATPTTAFDELSTTLEEAFKKIEFTPAIEHGKPVEKTIGLRLDLKNPRLVSPVEIDPATGKRIPKVISTGIMNGKARSLAKPEYPSEGRANRESGAVEVQVLVDEAGKVIRAGALNGGPHLQLPAREAACSSKFSPTLLSGNPVKVSGILTYNFVP